MSAEVDKGIASLDHAIIECENYIKEQRQSSQKLIGLLIIFGMVTLIGGLAFFMLNGSIRESFLQSTLLSTIITGYLILTSILIGVLVSLYRFHLLEIARTEHYKIGFLRIRVAANNPSAGFGSEVRTALTDGAFFFESSRNTKKGNLYSPLPGYPTSDISTALLNRLLDTFDVEMKPKRTHEHKIEN